jgi:hypothetical protein
LRNPSHSQLFFTRSLFKAPNLSSFIRGWVLFALPFTQPTVFYTVFIHGTESVESHTWVAEGLRNPSHSQLFFTRSLFKALNLSGLIRGWVKFAQSFIHSLCSIFIHRPESDGSHKWMALGTTSYIRVRFHYSHPSRHRILAGLSRWPHVNHTVLTFSIVMSIIES